jgi:hypothetical protein
MTHSTIATERENAGSLDTVYHVIDITALDSAGTEQYAPGDEVGLDDPGRFGIDVRAQEDTSVLIQYDHVADELSVTNVDDGSAVANDTDVGEVMLEVMGV